MAVLVGIFLVERSKYKKQLTNSILNFSYMISHSMKTRTYI